MNNGWLDTLYVVHLLSSLFYVFFVVFTFKHAGGYHAIKPRIFKTNIKCMCKQSKAEVANMSLYSICSKIRFTKIENASTRIFFYFSFTIRRFPHIFFLGCFSNVIFDFNEKNKLHVWLMCLPMCISHKSSLS